MTDETTLEQRELAESAGLAPETEPARSRLSGLATMPSWLGGVIGVVVIIVVWWLISFLFFRQDQSIPYPTKVLSQLLTDLGSSSFWEAITATTGSAAWGYLWGNLIAFGLAAIALLVPLLDGLVTQLAVVCSCIPLTALGPIVVIMGQPGSRAPSVILAAVSVIFTTVIGTILGLRAANQSQLDVVRAAGGSSLTQLYKVRLVAAIPAIMAALKIAAPAAFLGSVLGEYYLIGVDSGLGIQLISAQSNNNSDQLWALALVCGGVAGAAYFVIGLIGRLLSPWSEGTEGGR